MSEQSKQARADMKAKAKRMAAGEPGAKVDASSWSPPEGLNADKQTGLRPVSPRQFKRGGKLKGKAAAVRADRKPRKSGGAAMAEKQEVNDKINRDVKEANASKFGKPHIGGMKDGGKAKAKRVGKAWGGPMMGGTTPAPAGGGAPTTPRPPMGGGFGGFGGMARPAAGGWAANQNYGPMTSNYGVQTPQQAADYQSLYGSPQGGVQAGTQSPVSQLSPFAQQQQAMANRPYSMTPTTATANNPGGTLPAAALQSAPQLPPQAMQAAIQNAASYATPQAMSQQQAQAAQLAQTINLGGQNYTGAQLQGMSQDQLYALQKAAAANPTAPTGYPYGGAGSLVGLGGQAQTLPAALGVGQAQQTQPAVGGNALYQQMLQAQAGQGASGSQTAAALPWYLQQAASAVPRKAGGSVNSRIARASGGKTGKGKTNIIIAVNPQGSMGGDPMQQAQGARPQMPVAVPAPPPQGMPMQMPAGPPPAPPQAGAPPPAQMMPRKTGGRALANKVPKETASSYKDMTAGALSGIGRLQKTSIAKKQGNKLGGPP